MPIRDRWRLTTSAPTKAKKTAFLHRTTSGGVCINDVIFHIAQEDMPFGGDWTHLVWGLTTALRVSRPSVTPNRV